jgi:hypothetical protein
MYGNGNGNGNTTSPNDNPFHRLRELSDTPTTATTPPNWTLEIILPAERERLYLSVRGELASFPPGTTTTMAHVKGWVCARIHDAQLRTSIVPARDMRFVYAGRFLRDEDELLEVFKVCCLLVASRRPIPRISTPHTLLSNSE